MAGITKVGSFPTAKKHVSKLTLFKPNNHIDKASINLLILYLSLPVQGNCNLVY